MLRCAAPVSAANAPRHHRLLLHISRYITFYNVFTFKGFWRVTSCNWKIVSWLDVMREICWDGIYFQDNGANIRRMMR